MEDVMFIFLYHIFNLHFPEGTIQYCNELLLLRFDVLWKLKSKYISSYLNASAKLQNTRRASRYPTVVGNCWTCSPMSKSYHSSEWFVSPLHKVCETWDTVTCTFWEKSWSEMYVSKRTQKCKKNEKERWWYTNW